MTRLCLLAIAFLLLWADPLTAQWYDALLPKRGELLLQLSGENITAGHRFDPDGNARPLSELFAVELDARLVAPLNSLDSLAADLFPALDLSTPPPSTLGRLRYDVLLERTRAPISLTFSATDWLAVFVVVPVVQGQSFVGPQLDSLTAAAGTGQTAFGADPDGFFDGLAQGISELEAIVAADTLTAELKARAEGLIADARVLEAGLVSLGGLDYVPTDSSAAGRALTQYYEGLRTSFQDFAVQLPPLTLARPLSAAEAALLSSGPSFGTEPIAETSTGVKLGDIELGLSVQPVNTFRRRPGGERSRVPLRARLDALWRLASGDPPHPERLTDLGTGDGQADLEFRSTLDVGYGRRVWLSLHAAYNAQFATTERRLITNMAAPIQLGAYVTEVRRNPGDAMTIAAIPRFNLTEAITLSLLYSIVHHGRDNVRPVGTVPPDAVFLPADLEVGTEYTARRLGFAARLAATDWSGDRRKGLPIEAELRYWRTISSRDGFASRDDVWQVGLRLYRSIFR